MDLERVQIGSAFVHISVTFNRVRAGAKIELSFAHSLSSTPFRYAAARNIVRGSEELRCDTKNTYTNIFQSGRTT